MDPIVEAMRQKHLAAGLNRADLDANPIRQFSAWLADAVSCGLWEPRAAVLGTADARATPSARIVLLREFDEQGFTFYTNYGSRKATELADNPRAVLLFGWHALERQANIEGAVERVDPEQSSAYFATRSRESQLGAWASVQSTVVPSRDHLDRRVDEVGRRFPGEVPRPEHWGGFRVLPQRMEFWQGRPNRLHDRLCYQRDDNRGWTVQRLAP